jgi:hypothetical protein
MNIYIDKKPSLTVDELMNFMNEVYSNWGTIDILRWRYFENNGLEIRTVNILECDSLAAFRGIFFRNILLNYHKLKFGILADAGVLPEKRGKGYYNKLISIGLNTMIEEKCYLSGTYTQFGNITYDKYKKLGWSESMYPVKIKVLSYNKVFMRYFEKVLVNNSKLKRIIELNRDKINLYINGEKITFFKSTDNNSINIFLNNKAFEELINNRHRSFKVLIIISLVLFFKRDIKIKTHTIKSFLSFVKSTVKNDDGVH